MQEMNGFLTNLRFSKWKLGLLMQSLGACRLAVASVTLLLTSMLSSLQATEVDVPAPLVQFDFSLSDGSLIHSGTLENIRLAGPVTTAPAVARFDRFGDAWQSDPSATSPLRIRRTATFNTPTITQRTVHLWIYPTSTAGLQIAYAEGANSRGLILGLLNGQLIAGGWNHRVDNWQGTWLFGPQLPVNQWSSVALRLDGGPTQVADGLDLWLNGEIVDSGPAAQLIRRGDSTIGGNYGSKRWLGNRLRGLNAFSGQIDDFYLADTALDNAQIVALSEQDFGLEPRISGPELTAVGIPTDFDGSASFNAVPQQKPLTYFWQVVPLAGMNQPIALGNDEQVSWTPTVAEDVMVRLTITNAEGESAYLDYPVTVAESLVVADDALLGLWRFDEENGAVIDHGPHALDGTFRGGARTDVDPAWLLPGAWTGADSSRFAVEIPANPTINLPRGQWLTQRTVQAWVRYQNDGQAQIIYEEGGSGNGLVLGVDDLGQLQALAYTRNARAFVQPGMDAALVPGRMTHVAAVLDIPRGAVVGELRLYLDGEEVGSLATAPRIPRHNNANGLGGRAGGTSALFTRSNGLWRGSLAEVRLDGRALSAGELIATSMINAAPTLDVIPATDVEAGQTLTLASVSVGDADAGPDNLSVSWQQIAGPVGVTIADPLLPVATLPEPGVYQFSVAADDGRDVVESVVTIVAEDPLPLVTPAAAPLVFEMEDFQQLIPGLTGSPEWTPVSDPDAVAGVNTAGNAMSPLPNSGINYLDTVAGARLRFQTTLPHEGPWYPWVRLKGASGTDDSVHLMVDGVLLSAGNFGMTANGNWRWVRTVSGRPGDDRVVFSAGDGLTNIDWLVREDGVLVDRFILHDDPSWRPSGAGPDATVLDDGAPVAVAGDDRSLALPADGSGLQVRLDGSASYDPDNGPSPLSATWTQLSGPTVAINASVSPLDAQVSLASVGTYVFELEVTDGQQRARDTVTFVTTGAGQSGLLEQDGFIAFEAENYTSSAGAVAPADPRWLPQSDSPAVVSGGQFMAALPNNGVNFRDTLDGHRLDYEITFTTPGTYTVWVRLLGPTGNDDSVHVGLDQSPASFGNVGLTRAGSTWNWTNRVNGRPGPDEVTVTIPAAGTYTFNAWLREDGASIDSFILTTDASYRPSGLIDIDPPSQWLVDAGPDQSAVVAPDSYPAQVTLNGSVQPSAAAVVVTSWSQVGGPAAVITDPASAQTVVTLPEAGTYVFALTASEEIEAGQPLVERGSDTIAVAYGGYPAVWNSPDLTDLSGYWRFEAPGATSVRDWSGGARSGSLSYPWHADQVTTGGPVGNAGGLAVRSYWGWAEIPASTDAQPLAWSAAGWLKLDVPLRSMYGDFVYMMHNKNLPVNTSGFGIGRFARYGNEFGAQLFLEDGSQLIASWNEESVGEWFHVGATYDGQTLIVYRNGQEMSRAVAASVQPVAASAAPLRLGLSLEGVTDEVAYFSRHLPASAIATLARFAPTSNEAPLVDAGPDQVLGNASGVILHGHVSDDGLPVSQSLTTEWMQLSGPNAVIADPSALLASVTLAGSGSYVFQLRATDGVASATDVVHIRVGAAAASIDAGPDLAQWAFVDLALPDASAVSPTASWLLAAAPHAAAAASASLQNGVFQAQVPGRYRLRLQDGDRADDCVVVIANYYDTAPGLLADYHFDADAALGDFTWDYHRLEHDIMYAGAAPVVRDENGIANGPWATTPASTGDDLQPSQGGGRILVRAVAGESGQWFGIGDGNAGWQLVQDGNTMRGAWYFAGFSVTVSAPLSAGVAQQWDLFSDGRTVQLWRDEVLVDAVPLAEHEAATAQGSGALSAHAAGLTGVLVEAQVVEVAQPPVAATNASN